MKPSELLEQKEWIQHHYLKVEGKKTNYSIDRINTVRLDWGKRLNPEEIEGCCMAGAIRMCQVFYGLPLTPSLADLWSTMDIPIWNDTPGRTKEEVINKLKEYGL